MTVATTAPDYLPAAVYSPGERERVYVAWCECGYSAERTAWRLAARARAETADGEPIPATPNARTIAAWMRQEDWLARRAQEWAQGMPEARRRWMMMDAEALDQAKELRADLLAGKYDHDVRLYDRARQLWRDIEESLGWARHGANAGGPKLLRAEDLLPRERQTLSPGEESRQLRERQDQMGEEQR